MYTILHVVRNRYPFYNSKPQKKVGVHAEGPSAGGTHTLGSLERRRRRREVRAALYQTPGYQSNLRVKLGVVGEVCFDSTTFLGNPRLTRIYFERPSI